jgi:hypothetical protein
MIHFTGMHGIMILTATILVGPCRLAGDGVTLITDGDMPDTVGDTLDTDGVTQATVGDILVTVGDIIRPTILFTRFIRELVMLITSTDKDDLQEPM